MLPLLYKAFSATSSGKTKKNSMPTINIFQCASNKLFNAFTYDDTTENLPGELCKEWTLYKKVEGDESTVSLMGVNPKEIIEKLKTKKYVVKAIQTPFILGARLAFCL
jgi:hypothetical protein